MCTTELWLLTHKPFHLLDLSVPTHGVELVHDVLGGRGRLVPHVAELLLEAEVHADVGEDARHRGREQKIDALPDQLGVLRSPVTVLIFIPFCSLDL